MLRVLFAVFVLAAWQTNAYAVHNVTTCGETCASGEQCNLVGNLSCTTNPALTLATGADLDFKGYTITYTGSYNQAQGVVVTAANSIIDDSVGGGGTRGFPIGINCNHNNSSIVRDVHVDGATSLPVSSGIAGCRKVERVVVTNTKNYGITNNDIGDSDYIRDSYIMGAYGAGFSSGTDYGIWVEGDGSGEIDHNVIGNIRTLSILAFFTDSSLEVTNNILFNQTYGNGLIGTGAFEPVMSGNVCGDPNAPYGYACASCISAGACEPLTTPLTVP